MASRNDQTLQVIDKISQWSGVDPIDVGNFLDNKNNILNRIIFIGNATARMQVPVHPHGWWRGGNVGYDPNNQRLITNTLVNVTDDFTTAASPVSRQLYTVTTAKTLYVTYILFWWNGNQVVKLRDDTADGGTIRWQMASNNSGHAAMMSSIVPIAFTKGIRLDAADLPASLRFMCSIVGFEEET